MKYKSYGDNNKEFSSGNDLELLTVSDKLSARSLNRPSENLYENQEEIYKLINTLLKTTYGNIEKAIIPDLYEEFAPDGFYVNSFKGSTNYYLRIPTGSMLLTTNKKDENLSAYGEEGYIDTNSDYKYSRLGKDYVFTNKPNINLLERQLASLIDLDLNDTYNDIKIETVELPVAHMVYKVSTGSIPFPEGKIDVLSKDGKTLYICTKENAEYYCNASEIKEDSRTLRRPKYQNTNNTFKKYYYTNDAIVINKVTETTNGEGYKYFTTKIEKAIFAEDENKRAKKCIGYCLKATKNLLVGSSDYYFPNKRERAYFDLYLSDLNETGANNYKLIINEDNTDTNIVKEYIVKKVEGMNVDDLYYLLISSINSSNDNIFAENISKVESGTTYKGIRISFGTRYLDTFDNYTVSLRKGNASTFSDYCVDKDSEEINKLSVNKSVRQEYYRNIFDLVNEFLDKFKPYTVPTADKLLNYLSGEILLPLKEKQSNYYIYYDITADKNKVIDDPRYDKSGRIFISTKGTEDTENEKDEIIKLFEVGVNWGGTDVQIPKINSIEYFIPRLDKRLISTKRGEFQTLSAKNGDNDKVKFTVGKDGTVVTGGLTVDTIKSSGEGGDSTLNIDTLVANEKVQTNSIKPLNPTDYTTVDKLKIVDGIEGNGNVINVIVGPEENPNSKLPDNNKNGEWKIIKREVVLKELK